MSTAPTRVFAARLAGLPVFDPLGDRVGRVRDVCVGSPLSGRPRALGLVVEVTGRRRVFVQMTRVTSLDAGQVITTGLVNLRRFQQRSHETLVLGELLDRTVHLTDGSGDAVVEDLALEQQRNRDWRITKVFVRRGVAHRGLSGRLRRRGETLLLDTEEITGLGGTTPDQPATLLVASVDTMKAADLADLLHDLSDKRRAEVVAELDDDRLADVLEELPEDDQVQILSGLARDRAADVLEAMQPDDAADLLAELSSDQQEHLLEAMEKDDADDVRRLMAYDDKTAGGLMTTEPVILSPEASVAEALALVRRSELSPTLAAAVFVCRPPMETPTGRFLGLVHIQRMLREAPHEAIGGIVDSDIEAVPPETTLDGVTRRLATYNLVSLPVTDEAGRLLGVVTADDVLDHLLPQDWREHDSEDDEIPAPPPTQPTQPTTTPAQPPQTVASRVAAPRPTRRRTRG